ncbi:hypothetical protein N780_17775 [Pontibacillus chungwhensis BH030062]|uniref:Glycosyltransferase 2-like domain-containing protein n=1 Tax=Pontibacillus chungwhensis BH030062 TaxID=1385513 RepID=A0A0A2US19_9BACI|nr:glycosyltransferase [Pontibacillus chungwhensis]KGP91102.1 hypothetical protein N780_17775 [Pontibacillus chungwhensis BH030062]
MELSVVTAVYNGAQYIEEAIDSILNQTYEAFEWIIVNDGSTDTTPYILDSITDKRVRIIHNDQNKGTAASLNKAIECARGDWIAIQDSDDKSVPHRLNTQLAFLKQHPKTQLVGSLISCIPGAEKISSLRLRKEAEGSNRFKETEELMKNRFHGCHLAHGTVMYSRSLFNEVGGYNPAIKVAHDYDLFMRLYQVTDPYKLNEVLYLSRVHPNSLCRSDIEQTWREVVEVSTDYLKRMIPTTSKIILIGSPQACKQLMLLNKPFPIYEHIDVSSLKGENHADPSQHVILILDHKHANRISDRMERKGFSLGENLFKLWNVYG